jgi:erythronate-4-phosphate dehydrogenase
MRIVADENIVALDTYSEFGELIKLPGRKISAADVRDADALIVRSITAVNQALLEGSRVQFVATATSGTNHLDLEWLAAAGITVTDAAGCNADAVVEYVFTSIGELIRGWRFSLRDKTFAVIGAGHVGGRLLRLLQRLGIRCIACDPYVENAHLRGQGAGAHCSASSSGLSLGLSSGSWMEQGGFKFGTLEEALSADIISIHTPLTYTGDHPTFHLINAERLAALKPGTLLINAARGEIVDNAALLLHLQSNPGRLLTIFDVWETEPTVSPDLAALVDIATPHIAGYSIEAKVSASVSNFHSFLKHFHLEDPAHVGNSASVGKSNEDRIALVLPEGVSLKDIVADDPARQWQVAEAVCHAFQVMKLSDEFKSGVGKQDGDALFDGLRKKLTLRHEYGLRYLI